MSDVIINQASFTIDQEDPKSSCPVVTLIEPELQIIKRAITKSNGEIILTQDEDPAGIIGSDHKVLYDFILFNPSTNDIAVSSFKDVLTLDPVYKEGTLTQAFDYIGSESTFATNKGTEINEILFSGEGDATLLTVPAESCYLLHYTVRFKEDVPLETLVKNKAQVSYAPPDVPERTILSNEISLNLDYPIIMAVKTGEAQIKCSDPLTYTLTFTNSGSMSASNVKITDELPIKFQLDETEVTIQKSTGESTGETIPASSYTLSYDPDTGALSIEAAADAVSALDIGPNEHLTVTLPGIYNCTFSPVS